MGWSGTPCLEIRKNASMRRPVAGLTGGNAMRKLTMALAAVALGATAMAEPATAQQNEQFVPLLV